MMYPSWDNQQVSRRDVQANPLLVRTVLAQVKEACAIEDVASLFIFEYVSEEEGVRIGR